MADAVEGAVRGFTGDPGQEVGTGASGAPTSRIDRVAEEAVLRVLDERGDRVNVVSEEIGDVDRGGGDTLVVDPIDGTLNMVTGIPSYAVSLAVGRSSLRDVTHALVRNLVAGETFYAEAAKGATLNGARIRVRPFVGEGSLASVYLGTNAAPESYDVARKARRVRNLGAASLDLCLVARGAADLYYMHSALQETKLRVVDVAAGALIVREAGGLVLDLEGRDLDMPLDPTARADLVAASSREALEALT